jgi:hypothetical protein
MMTDELRAGVLSAPVAAIDRRELSQAWYSALGFARKRSVAAAAPAASPKVRALLRPAGLPDSKPPFRRSALPAVRLVVTQKAAENAEAAAERRRRHSRLASQIERAFARPHPPARATFTVDNGGARVHVMMQNRDDGLRLIALCSPANRTLVARALARACFALAGRGVTLTLDNAGVLSCF